MNNILDGLISTGQDLIRIAPALLMIPLVLYTMGDEGTRQVESILMLTPAQGIIDSGYDYYPAYLDEEDVVIRPKTYTDEDGNEFIGAVIEVRKPVALAEPKDTGSMQPLFGAGNMLVQEIVDESTQLQDGDIVVYESDNTMIIHQITGKEGSCYVLKGMNNGMVDPVCVSQDMIKYRLIFAIPTK
jgi:hypothetical protein